MYICGPLLTLYDTEEYHRCDYGLSVELTDIFNQSLNRMTLQPQELQSSGSSVIGQPMRGL